MRWGCILVHIHNEHRILPYKIQENKIGVTIAVTPISYSFEPVIAASKQLLYGVRPDPGVFLSCGRYEKTPSGYPEGNIFERDSAD